MTYFIVNGQLVAAEQATVSAQDRGFRFGDGLFETIAIYSGVPYQFDWHMQRLAEGLQAIKIAFDIKCLKDFSRQLIRKNKVDNGILRIQITRGIGSKGYLPDPSHSRAGAALVIETSPLPTITDKPIGLWQSTYTKISPRALPVKYKLCQGLNSTLARLELRRIIAAMRCLAMIKGIYAKPAPVIYSGLKIIRFIYARPHLRRARRLDARRGNAPFAISGR